MDRGPKPGVRRQLTALWAQPVATGRTESTHPSPSARESTRGFVRECAARACGRPVAGHSAMTRLSPQSSNAAQCERSTDARDDAADGGTELAGRFFWNSGSE